MWVARERVCSLEATNSVKGRRKQLMNQGGRSASVFCVLANAPGSVLIRRKGLLLREKFGGQIMKDTQVSLQSLKNS